MIDQPTTKEGFKLVDITVCTRPLETYKMEISPTAAEKAITSVISSLLVLLKIVDGEKRILS